AFPAWLRSVATFLLGLGAALAFVHFLPDPPTGVLWLAWDFARIWAWQLFFCAACLSAGPRILVMLRASGVASLELAVTSMAVGVVVFVFGMYAGGVAHLYGPVFAVALPTAMLVSGIPALLPQWPRLRRWLRGAPRSAPPLAVLIHGFGAVGAGL